MDGAWNEIARLCETQNVPVTVTNDFKMNNLNGDTYYRIEVRVSILNDFFLNLSIVRRLQCHFFGLFPKFCFLKTFFPLQAHNAIGFSQPSSLLMRTARGESTNALGSLLYAGYSGNAATALRQTTATTRDVVLLFMFSCCVRALFVR